MPENHFTTLCRTGFTKVLFLTGLLVASFSFSTTDMIWAASAEPDRIERHGEVEVVIHARHSRNANYNRESAYEAWSLRWRGQPVEIDSFGGMWLDQPMRTGNVNSIFVVGTGDRPEIIVNVGDPNNASVFHLLHQMSDRLAAPVLCKTFGGDNAVRVLEGKDAGEIFHGPNYRSLVGMRSLLLGSACVYDIVSGKVLPIPYKPEGIIFPTYLSAMTLSPDSQAFARAGLDYSSNLVLLVADLEKGHWSQLPIDPRRMRYSHLEAIDTAWIKHHFQWTRGAGGHDRLVERTGFKPLPWRGRFLENAAQYDVLSAEVDYSKQLGEFLTLRFQAKRLPGEGRWQEGGLKYEVEQEMVNITDAGFYIALNNKPYWPGQPGDPKRQMQLIRRIGEAFDAELAAGQHEAMFVVELDKR